MNRGNKNPLPQLLVNEAVREIAKKFEGVPDNRIHINLHIYNFAKHPGFAMVSQLCRNMPMEANTLEEICTFLSTIFSKTLFGADCKYQISQKAINKTLTFTYETPPPWFDSLLAGTSSPSEQYVFWYNAYKHFLEGTFAGALLHFGYKVVPTISKEFIKPLTLNFVSVEEMEGNWRFSALSDK